MLMADRAETARQKAEARRQKILARQQDRLTRITGSYGPDTGASDTPTAPAPSEEPAVASLSAQPVTVTENRESQELNALLNAVDSSLQRVQAALASAEGMDACRGLGNAPQAPAPAPAAAATCSQPASTVDDARHMPELPPSASGSASVPAAASSDAASTDSLQLSSIIIYGHKLGSAVQWTHGIRLLTSVLFAYACLHKYMNDQLIAVPPLVVLWCMQLTVIITAVFLSKLWPSALQRKQQADIPPIPMRLQQLDLMRLIPGANEALQALAGYGQMVSALYTDAMVYIVACGLLLVTA
eukprot:jgi/Chrzof1/9958/Cz04g21320.t1